MPIIDSQIHPYEANSPQRPWHSTPANWSPSANADENVAAMDKLGIDGAILISAFTMYRYDASYAVEAHKAHPDRFANIDFGIMQCTPLRTSTIWETRQSAAIDARLYAS